MFALASSISAVDLDKRSITNAMYTSEDVPRLNNRQLSIFVDLEAEGSVFHPDNRWASEDQLVEELYTMLHGTDNSTSRNKVLRSTSGVAKTLIRNELVPLYHREVTEAQFNVDKVSLIFQHKGHAQAHGSSQGERIFTREQVSQIVADLVRVDFLHRDIDANYLHCPEVRMGDRFGVTLEVRDNDLQIATDAAYRAFNICFVHNPARQGTCQWVEVMGTSGDAHTVEASYDHVQANLQKKYNVVWMLIDDVCANRFPEYGNGALTNMLPGFRELRDDGAVYYENFYSPSSVCAPSQVALFSGMEPGDIGGQYQFAPDSIPGKADYQTVPPPAVQFVPERLRGMGYWATGCGKLDYQVGKVMPTFYNKITGGFLADTLHSTVLDNMYLPPGPDGSRRPFFCMLNLMDVHQFLTDMQRETPVPLSDPATGGAPEDLPFGQHGYTVPNALEVETTSEDGTVTIEGTAAKKINFATTDILGYRGAYDESTLTHANGSLPGYLPDDIGVKSILAKEYDMLRNLDYRLQKIIAQLKRDGVYDNTLIMLYGDHGSAGYKGKTMLQLQSLHTPLWIKYPADMQTPDGTYMTERTINGETDAHAFQVDTRMCGIHDLYPTVLSVLGHTKDGYMKGQALGGIYEDKKEREMMFATLNRVGPRQAIKAFAAISKTHMYARHLLNDEVIESMQEVSLLDESSLTADVIRDVELDTEYKRAFTFFLRSPVYDRMHKLMIDATQSGASYSDRYKFITADGSRAPAEALFNLTTDKDAVDNKLYTRTYTPVLGDDGKTVEKVTLTRNKVDESTLADEDAVALRSLRYHVDAWVDDQTWLTPTVNYEENLWGEENAMGRIFWPAGIQPQTSVPIISDLDATGTAAISNTTKGTVFRYAVIGSAEDMAIDRLDKAARDTIGSMSLVASGLETTAYTCAIDNTRTMQGFLYGGDALPVSFSWFLGAYPDTTVFVSEDATYMQITSQQAGYTYTFDTRDAAWNGTEHVGVNSDGTWVTEPLRLVGADGTFNMEAFAIYLSGPQRNEIFSGKNADGTDFVDYPRHATPHNRGFNPASTYFAYPGVDLSVETALQSAYGGIGSLPLMGYLMQSADFTTQDTRVTDGIVNKGNFAFVLNNISHKPSRIDRIRIGFQAYDYEALEWHVGTSAQLDVAMEPKTLVVQGVRKGYADTLLYTKRFGQS